jgi:HK97 family phage prohead protease
MGLLSFIRDVAVRTRGGREEFTAGPLDAWIAAQGGTGAGATVNEVRSAAVTRDFALAVPAVLRGRNVLCSIATLPLVTLNVDTRERIRAPLLEQIDPQVPNGVTLAMTVEDLIFDSVAWWKITATQRAGDWPVAAQHVASHLVTTEPLTSEALNTVPSGVDPSTGVYIDGVWTPGSRVIRFDSPNPPLLKAGRRTIKRAAMLEAAATMYAEDPRPLDYFTPAEDADPTEEDVLDALEKWGVARRTRATGFVPGALNYNEVQSPTPADLQLAQLQQQVALDLANMLGLDPEDVGVSTTSRTYSNAVDRRRDRINDTLAPYMRAITDRLSMNDVTRPGEVVIFDLRDYLKADPATQAQVDDTYLRQGVVTAGEVRVGSLNLPEIPVEPAPARQPAPTPANASRAEPQETTVTQPPIAATFAAATDPAIRHVTFDVPAGAAAFEVNSEKRTISGLAVPYGEVTSDWRSVSFAAGSVEVPDDPSRVKVLQSHDRRALLGVATSTSQADAGLMATLRISKTTAGDEALALAADGALDGMSVGVDIQNYEYDTETEVTTVTRATLREISLTPFPAFDSARVDSVTLTQQNKEPVMSEVAVPGTTPVAAPAAPAAPTFALPADFATQLAAALAPAMPQPQPLPADFAQQVAAALSSDEGRQVVNPNRPTPGSTAQVREPLPYRFDGRKGPNGHDFSTDLIAAGRHGDADAQSRLDKFMSQVFDTATDDVNELNPNRQRPDLWVDQKSYATPVWDAIRKGTIPDATPFTLPKFNSASGLVGDHTESTEPTAGTYTTTGQTITPGAISGKVEITRETMDQGGNPQVSTIIWAAIMRAWNEALEAKAVAVLTANAASITDIALTTAAADDALAIEIKQKLAALHYVRGGFTMRRLFLQVDLYNKLVGAVDSTGRPLFPVVDAANSDGTTDAFFGGVRIGGLVGVPSWALAATGTVSANSWLFDDMDVHGWASAPQRLQFEYQVKSIEVGVWGYQATAITDFTGVRQITYDPTA